MKNKINLFDATNIVVGSMIGSGIFLVPSIIANYLPNGWYMIALWITGGLITITGALTYAEIANKIPEQGGQYTYLKKLYNSFIGFLFAWTLFFVIQSGTIAAVAIAFAKYLGTFFNFISENNYVINTNFFKLSTAQIIAIISIWILTYINIKGIKLGALFQNIFTISKVLAIIILVILAFSYKEGTFNNLNSINPKYANESLAILLPLIALSLSKIFFAYDAWYSVTYISHEVQNPKVNIPLSMVLGTLIVTFIYVITNLAYLYVIPISEMGNIVDNRVAQEVAARVLPNIGPILIALGIIISTLGCNNGLILSGPRVIATLAHDKLFNPKLAKLHQTYETPYTALIFQGLWTTILIIIGTYNQLLTYVTFASILFNVLTVISVFILRKKYTYKASDYKTFLYPITPLIYIIFGVLFLVYLIQADLKSTLAGLIIVLSGTPVYIYYKNKQTET
ncbi:MAG: amino acid permease [bacterium]|nr:amino acid permease [bacterium]